MNDNILYIVGLLSIVSLLCVRAFYIKKMSALKSKNSELTEVISDFEKIKSQLLILKEKQMASVKNDVDTESDVVERVENVENMENVAVVSDMELDFDDISDVNDDDTLDARIEKSRLNMVLEDSIGDSVEDLVVEDLVVEDLVVKDPVVEDPVVKDPVVKDPVVKDPVVKDPVVEDPVVEKTVKKSVTKKPDYSNMKVTDLKKLVKEKGVKNTQKMNKATLISHL